jgi:hypothetical protein
VNERLSIITRLLTWLFSYIVGIINNGHARNEEEGKAVERLFVKELSEEAESYEGFYREIIPVAKAMLVCIYQTGLSSVLSAHAKVGLTSSKQQPIMKDVESAHYYKRASQFIERTIRSAEL